MFDSIRFSECNKLDLRIGGKCLCFGMLPMHHRWFLMLHQVVFGSSSSSSSSDLCTGFMSDSTGAIRRHAEHDPSCAGDEEPGTASHVCRESCGGKLGACSVSVVRLAKPGESVRTLEHLLVGFSIYIFLINWLPTTNQVKFNGFGKQFF